MKKYWELKKPWKWLLFSFLVFGIWLLGCSKKNFFSFSVWKKPRWFIWGSIYSWTMDGFFRIFKKAVSELICTRLYILLFTGNLEMDANNIWTLLKIVCPFLRRNVKISKFCLGLAKKVIEKGQAWIALKSLHVICKGQNVNLQIIV